MKTLLVTLDGVADRTCVQLGNKTPLEAARKPNLDRLARDSVLFNTHIAGKIAPESDVGVLSLLGINPFQKHVGRAIFEWLSTGKRFENGWLALRANFATVDKRGKILDRRAGRSLSRFEAKQLEQEINAIKLGTPFEFLATSGHRGVVVFKGDFSKHIQNTDPAYQKNKKGISNAKHRFASRVARCVPLSSDSKSKKTAALVNAFTRAASAVLEKSEVNRHRKKRGQLAATALLLRDGETKLPKENYSEWTIVAGMPLEIGIGKAFQMKVEKIAEGNYKKIAAIVSSEIKKRNVYVHLKGPDDYGHDGDVFGKRRSIEAIDHLFFGNLKVDLSKTRIIVTGDHATPCELKAHSNDSVPALIAGGKLKGQNNNFDEPSANKQKTIAAWKLLRTAALLV